ncbi:MAG: MATE family efflux transporter [Clostridia bacterium]|nr:MATE family efflux transporter [Clostridia bacterium]
MSDKKKDLNMLEGPLFSKIIIFTIPLMITNLLQVCYSAADMIIVGFSNVEGAIGSIGTTGALINLVVNIFIGFSVGTNVIVARNIGRGDKTATEKAVHTSVLFALICGIICAVVGLFISRPILAMMGNEGHILGLSSLYTKIYFLGTPFLAMTNYLIAILRAKGDTKTPLYILSASGLINVLLNLLFVFVFKMSVDGVSLATVLSNVMSMVLLFIKLLKDDSWCKLQWSKFKMSKSAILDIITVGLPAGIQGALFSISNMLIQSSLIGINNTLCPGGSAIIDGHAASGSLEGFAYTATNSVCQAATTFTSQHFGARKFKRIGAVMKNCYLITGIIALICTAVIFGFKDVLIGLYVSDPLAVETALTRNCILIIPYFLVAFMEVGSGIVRGLGRSITSTVVSLIGSCLLRIVWIYTIFQWSPNIETLYLSYPVSWGLTALIQFIVAITTRKKYMKELSYSEQG